MGDFFLVIVLALLFLVIFLFLQTLQIQKSKRQENEFIEKFITTIQSQINEVIKQQSSISKELSEKINEQNRIINEQLTKSQNNLLQQFSISQKSVKDINETTSKIVKEVTEKLIKLEETNKQVVSFASQLQSLEKILKNPKQRGVLGEYFLETTLKNVLPPNTYQMQYKFANGEIVDAVIFLKDKIIPIDSKFSLENYNRIIETEDPIEREKLQKEFKVDLKNRIDETSKYIKPSEKTVDFAFMFIPSEALYYDLLINKIGTLQVNTQDLITYAFTEKSVVIVSPTSFLAYLQTVLQGLKALQIEESAKQIKENVRKLAEHLKAYNEHFDKVGKNLGTTVNFYNKAVLEFRKIDKDVLKITEKTFELQSNEVEKPNEFN